MSEVNVINTITVPPGMEQDAERVRDAYVEYFRQQPGFVGSRFYRSQQRETDGSLRYVNIVVWASQADFDRVVNDGFSNAEGMNADGMKVLGKGFPPPIKVSPGQFFLLAENA